MTELGDLTVSVPVVPSTFWSVFRSRILNADPGPATRINADPCGSGSETLLVVPGTSFVLFLPVSRYDTNWRTWIFLYFDPYFAAKELLRGKEEQANRFSFFKTGYWNHFSVSSLKCQGGILKWSETHLFSPGNRYREIEYLRLQRRIYDEGLLSYRRNLPPSNGKNQKFNFKT
jgi:hypothetical protein